MMSCGAILPSRSRRPAVPWNASEAACSCALSFSRSVSSPIAIAPACCRGGSVDAEPQGEHWQAEDEGAGEQREGAVRQARGDLGLDRPGILLLREEASGAAVPRHWPREGWPEAETPGRAIVREVKPPE